ncbi:hypothetical protein NQ318_018254 [Aromia moschata]|uniref:Myb/SANT-like DNA-binding domain-containing protein n=1 Tax=Aromia moschata TaxID=1265417 RepID=A0AAV8ZDJ2_9CUCU|nr:hypothetical protein NQ318_018254 [Aromia moschata]
MDIELGQNDHECRVFPNISAIIDTAPLEETDIYNKENAVNDKFTWTHSNTLLFLEEYEKRVEKFRNPKIKKRELWSEIANEMKKMGYAVHPDILDKKMRNMRSTYTKIVDNNKTKIKTGRGRIKWEYFDRFQQIFAVDKTVNPVNLESSLPLPGLETATPNEDLVEDSCTSSEACNSNWTPSRRWKRLDVFRKRQLDLELEKIEEIKLIRKEMEKYNDIQKKKLELFEKYLSCK